MRVLKKNGKGSKSPLNKGFEPIYSNVNNFFENNSQNYSQDKEGKFGGKFNNKYERKPNVNKLSKALKFSYNDYEHVVNPVHEVSSEDLLRVVVARSYTEGQMALKRSLETVLRAMNHECQFPSLPKHNKFEKSEKQMTQTD